jgi:hypothetical protein
MICKACDKVILNGQELKGTNKYKIHVTCFQNYIEHSAMEKFQDEQKDKLNYLLKINKIRLQHKLSALIYK